MDRMAYGPSERPLEPHHPQKNTPRTTPAPLPAYLPPAAQPPVQIPFSDPFHNRDPFLPSSQNQRRGSYGPLGGAPLNHYAGERAWTHAPGEKRPVTLIHEYARWITNMACRFGATRSRSSVLFCAVRIDRLIGSVNSASALPCVSVRASTSLSNRSISAVINCFRLQVNHLLHHKRISHLTHSRSITQMVTLQLLHHLTVLDASLLALKVAPLDT